MKRENIFDDLLSIYKEIRENLNKGISIKETLKNTNFKLVTFNKDGKREDI